MLKYPLRLNQNETDYVRFTHSEYRTNMKSSVTGNGGQAPITGESIVLYMPNSTPPDGHVNNWSPTGEMFRGPLGKLKAFGAKSASDIMSGVEDSLTGKAGVGDLLKGGIDNIGEAGTFIKDNAGAAIKQTVVDKVGNSLVGGGNNFLALTQGKIFNPNIELLYKGPQLRQFVFEFNFVPRSALEATQVNNIIKEFKIWSTPKADGNYLKVPDVWHISYGNTMTAQYMNKFKPCALTSFELQDNASSDGHYTFIDGVPVSTAIRMVFQEVDIITREDHENGGARGF